MGWPFWRSLVSGNRSTAWRRRSSGRRAMGTPFSPGKSRSTEKTSCSSGRPTRFSSGPRTSGERGVAHYGRRSQASRPPRSDDPQRDRHLGHLARHRIPLEADLLFSPRKEATRRKRSWTTYLRKILEGKVGRAIGGIRQMATKRGLSKPKRKKVEQCPNYFDARARADEVRRIPGRRLSDRQRGGRRCVSAPRQRPDGANRHALVRGGRAGNPQPKRPSTSTTIGISSTPTGSKPNNAGCTPTKKASPTILNCAT